MVNCTTEQAKKIMSTVQAAGFDKAEVIMTASDMTEMQVDAGDVSLMRSTEDLDISIRGIRGGRFAMVSLNQTDDESLKAGLKKLNDAIESAPVDSARAFAPKQPAAKAITEGPSEPSLDKMYSRMSDFVSLTGDKYPALKLEQSGVQFRRSRYLRVNSEGLELDETSGHYSMSAMFSSKVGDKMSSFNFTGAIAKDLNRDFMQWGSTARLIENSVKEVNHEAFNGKFKGAVVLTPDCVFDLLGTWFSHLGDLRMISETSQLRDKIGQAVASSLLTVRVEPTHSDFAVHEHSTGDGYASAPSVIIEKGVLKSYMLSDYGSRKTGLPRAVNSGGNRVIDAGDTSYADIISSTKQGLLLGRFSGGSPAANGDFSGVAKNSFLIEGGEITRPVSEVMISGNAFEMMRSISAISKERVNDGGTLTPWVKVEGLTVAGAN
jgi:PmbA protein